MIDFKTVPVTQESFDETLKLLNKVFKTFTEEENPFVWYKVSLDPGKHADFMKTKGVRDVRYFSVIDKANKKVIGATGLYHLLRETPETVWLGFYCLDEKYRGQGIGKKILEWTVDKARNEGNTLLKLYTSPNEELEKAQEIYKKFGFIKTGEEEKNGEITTYMELALI